MMTGILAVIKEWMGPLLGGALGGALATGVINYFTTTRHDSRRREREIADLKTSIYIEIADRAARCVSDYLNPWQNLKAKNLSAERVGKFRPIDPVVFRGNAGKLGLLGAEAVIAVTQFYFRLEALSQAIDSLHAVYERRGGDPTVKPGDESRVELIRTRLRSCFEPALSAIESLDVRKAAEFDKEVAREYSPRVCEINCALSRKRQGTHRGCVQILP